MTGYGDPNRCPACVARGQLCDAHLARMRDEAAAAVELLAQIDATHAAELDEWDRLLREEAMA